MTSLIATIAKFLLALVACVIAVFAANASILASERHGEAGIFSGIHATDGLVQLQAVRETLAAEPNHKFQPTRLEQMRLTLIAKPLNAQVLAILGLAAASNESSSSAVDQLMTLANRVTRREPLSQMWMIEKSSSAGDVPGAIRHYHTVMSANPDMYATLFPVLVAALDFPEVQKAIGIHLHQDARWMPSFLSFAASNAKVDSLLGMIGQNYRSLRPELYKDVNATIVFRLAEQGRTDDAVTYAKNVMPDFDKQKFMEFGISSATLDKRMGKMAWTLTDDQNASASLADSGAISLSIQPSQNAVLLSRHLVVKPGAGVRFSHALIVESDSLPPSAKWQVSCASRSAGLKQGQVWEQVVPVSSNQRPVEVRFPGFSNCSFVQITLSAITPDSQTPTTLRLSNFSQVPDF